MGSANFIKCGARLEQYLASKVSFFLKCVDLNHALLLSPIVAFRWNLELQGAF